MPRGREVFPDDLGEEPGAGPDADSGHARQDRVKRVRLNDAFDLGRDLIALSPQLGELLREAWDDDPGRVRADHGHGLLVESVEDLLRPYPALARRTLQKPGRDALLPSSPEVDR